MTSMATRTLTIYINHPEDGNPEEMTEDHKTRIIKLLDTYLPEIGLETWRVDGEFEDEG
jgi:hypothetical protein